LLEVERMSEMEQDTEKIPVVTKIVVQKKRKDRFNIYVDGEYSFPISEAVLIKVGLYKGMQLTKERSLEIERENYDYMAYTTAVNYLSYSLRSEAEVRKKLIDEEISEDAIERALTRLKEQNYVNDRIYGESYTRTAANLNRKGPQLIANELKTKGLSPETISLVLKEYPLEQQIENGIAIAEKMMRKQSRVSSREASNKLRAHLQQKGYLADTIPAILEEIETVKEEDDEMSALRLQGDKLWHKQERKHKGKDLIQKVKAGLFQKGYSGDMISAYIQEKEQEME
jgi:regulatory protein